MMTMIKILILIILVALATGIVGMANDTCPIVENLSTVRVNEIIGYALDGPRLAFNENQTVRTGTIEEFNQSCALIDRRMQGKNLSARQFLAEVENSYKGPVYATSDWDDGNSRIFTIATQCRDNMTVGIVIAEFVRKPGGIGCKPSFHGWAPIDPANGQGNIKEYGGLKVRKWGRLR